MAYDMSSGYAAPGMSNLQDGEAALQQLLAGTDTWLVA